MHESKKFTFKWPLHADGKLQNVIITQQKVYELSKILPPVQAVNKGFEEC